MADVDSTIAQGYTLAKEVKTSAEGALALVFSQLGGPLPDSPAIPEVKLGAPHAKVVDAPTYHGSQFKAPDLPDQPTLEQSTEFTLPEVPADTTGTAPKVALPSNPGAVPFFTLNLPTLDAIQAPPPLNYQSLLSGIAVPDRVVVENIGAPAVTIPEFTASKPTDVPTAPTDMTAQYQAAYSTIAPVMQVQVTAAADAWLGRNFPTHTSALAALEARLSGLLAGDSAMPDAVADAIVEKGRDQVSAEYVRTARSSYDEAAKRGFTLPTGTLMAGLRKARTSAADANARTSNEVITKRFELQYDMAKFAVEQCRTLRTFAIQQYATMFGQLVQLNGQSLEYARSVLQSLVEVFNSRVRLFEAQLEGYKAEAAVYSDKLRAALAVVEVYKARLEGERLKVEVNAEQVKIYEARIRAAEGFAQVYKTQVEAVATIAGLQRIKLELVQTQVQAYSAQVQAKSAEYGLYTATINGQVAQVQGYESSVRAYTAQVQAYTARVQAQAEKARAVLGINESRTRVFESQIRAFGAKVDASARGIEAEIAGYRAQLSGITEQNTAIAKQADVDLSVFSTVKELAFKQAQLIQTHDIENARIRVGQLGVIAQTAQGVAETYSRIAQAALAGQNSLVALEKTA